MSRRLNSRLPCCVVWFSSDDAVLACRCSRQYVRTEAGRRRCKHWYSPRLRWRAALHSTLATQVGTNLMSGFNQMYDPKGAIPSSKAGGALAGPT